MKSSFTHLHLHSQYSIIDGFSTVEEIIKTVKKHKMDSVALTDHGTLAGCLEFYKTAIENDIRPILGCEIYMASGSRHEKKLTEFEDKSSHLTVIAKNNNGFNNLINIVSIGYLEGFYYKPRVDMDVLHKFNEDLIVLSGCINSEFSKHIIDGNIDKAKRTIDNLLNIFTKDNFFIEVQYHDLKEDKKLLSESLKIAKDMNVKIVATNDCHYTNAENYYAYDCLLCIKNSRKLQDTDRLKLEPNEFYIKTADQMYQLFKDNPDALQNSYEISRMCDIKFDFSVKRIPQYKIENGKDSHTYLVELCYEGLQKRVKNVTDKYRKRIEHELNIVRQLGFSDYFLIVADIVKFAKSKGISVGPGRGSAASSLISYSLEITDLDPLQYDLLFERFLNIGRREPPDIDIDIEHQRRQEVIEYLKQRYGENNIAHIMTFGTLAAKAVIRDVGRVTNMPYTEVDRIAKMIPDAINITIEKAIETVEELKNAYTTNKTVKNLIDTAKVLEGRIRNISTHAAGVVISDKPLTAYIPLMKADETIITGVDANALVDLGMLKIDILGLKTLTIINKTVELIKIHRNINIKIPEIPLDDKKTYQMLSEGKTMAVFQLESTGMRDLLMKVKPQKIEDIIDVLALYRPGPLQSGMVDTYIASRKNPENIQYFHNAVKDFIKDTYGILLYQEQVMAIANKIGKLDLTEADILRKAMGKKDPQLLKPFREKFVKGAIENGLTPQDANRIFDAMEFFSGYGFNKSHSAAYGYISYITAYLKANYTLEYYCATLIFDSENLEKVSEYIQDCKNFGIEVVRPSINKSDVVFSINDGKIVFGLSAIKNIGTKAAETIVETRQRLGGFKNFYHFLSNIDLKAVNKEVLEALIKSGCCDEFNTRRRTLLNNLEKYLNSISQRSAISAGQNTLFATTLQKPEEIFDTDTTEEFSQSILLDFEKDYLGLYLTYDPLNDYKYELDNFVENSQSFKKIDNKEILIGGMIENFKNRLIKSGVQKGQRMIVLKMRDFWGYYDAYVFPANVQSALPNIVKNKIVVLRGTKSANREEPYVKVFEIFPIENIWDILVQEIKITIPDIQQLDDIKLDKLQQLLYSNKGNVSIVFYINIDGKKVKLYPDQLKIKPSNKLFEELNQLLGNNCYEIIKKTASIQS